jgi:hypothetical protein
VSDPTGAPTRPNSKVATGVARVPPTSPLYRRASDSLRAANTAAPSTVVQVPLRSALS